MNRLNIALASFFFFITQLLIPTIAMADPPKAVGTIPGAFSIGTDGAANYRIPLELPPGINGLKPDLALEYDSQKGNGLLGIGWRLTGFPAITRCPTTLEQDGFIDGVDFDDNDKYCLNGQRLVAINGDYGANGTEYRTEHNSYKKIISYGSAGSGPAYFKVWYKNGEIAEFGNTDDARVEAQGKSDVLHWAINKTEDRFGNAISYGYQENNTIGEHYPLTINYAKSIISLTYEQKPDPSLSFLSGSKVSVEKRLIEIKVINNEKTSVYNLSYSSQNSDQSRIDSIQKCAIQTCFPFTKFNWRKIYQEFKPSHAISTSFTDAQGWNSGQRYFVMDINGDG
ncbi:hypothetical protein KCM76_25535, partial [Zooshikella marina]